MAGTIEARLKELGIVLPSPPAPAANYVPFTRAGDLVFISGQLPMGPSGLEHKGRLGADCDLAAGQAAARLCAINIIAQIRAAAGGDLDRVRQVLKLVGFVASTPEFGDQPKVVNGASDLIAEVFGDKGKHARSAVGVAALPFGAAVEVEAFALID